MSLRFSFVIKCNRFGRSFDSGLCDRGFIYCFASIASLQPTVLRDSYAATHHAATSATSLCLEFNRILCLFAVSKRDSDFSSRVSNASNPL